MQKPTGHTRKDLWLKVDQLVEIINKQEKCIRTLAFYLQDPNHDEYRVLDIIDNILNN